MTRTTGWWTRATGFTLVSLLMMAGGLVVLGPTLVALGDHRLVAGRLVDVMPVPEPDLQQVRLALVFEYPVHGQLGRPGSQIAIGWGRADAYGSPMPDEQVSLADAPGHLARYFDDIERGRPYHVFVDPADPYESARIHSARSGLWRYQIGLLLLLTPPLLWASGRIGSGLGRLLGAWRSRQ